MCVKTSQIHETKRGASTHFDYARSGNYQNVVETKLLIQNQTFVRDTVYLTESRLWLKAAWWHRCCHLRCMWSMRKRRRSCALVATTGMTISERLRRRARSSGGHEKREEACSPSAEATVMPASASGTVTITNLQSVGNKNGRIDGNSYSCTLGSDFLWLEQLRFQ